MKRRSIMRIINKPTITLLCASFVLLGGLSTSASAETLPGNPSGLERPDGVGCGDATERPEGVGRPDGVGCGDANERPENVGRPGSNGHSSCYSPSPFGGMFSKMQAMQKLDLDEDQEAILLDVKDLMTNIRQAREESNPQDQVMALLSQPEFDQSEALSIIESRVAKMQEYAPQVIAAIASFTDSLSDEQRTQMQELSAQHTDACENGFDASSMSEMRSKVSEDLDFHIPSATIESLGEDSDFWVDLKYNGKDNQGGHSWKLEGYGENSDN